MRIYFIAICGTAMASLASMLKSQGHEVYGSDEHIYPPMSDFLQAQGITILEGFHESHLEPHPDLVVIGNAMSRGNPEVEYVLEHKIPYRSLPVVLKEFFIQGKTSLVITGTHGKTTTSSLVTWMLEKNNYHPSFLIGGIPENFGEGSRVGTGKHIVLEGDEYDTAFFDKGPKFFHYLPDLVVINNIEFDHADIYNNIDEIKLNFQRLINLIPRNGLLVANLDDPNVSELLKYAHCPVATFGLSTDAEWRIGNMKTLETGINFEVFHQNILFENFELPLFGLHNARNATATVITGNWLGLSKKQMQTAFSGFKGVRKRLQLKAKINNILIFDDFAHHPTEVRETVNGMRQRFPSSRIWAVFEPRTSTAKRNLFFENYLNAFSEADEVIWGPIHRPDKVKAEELLKINELFEEFKVRSISAYYFDNNLKIVDFLKVNLKPGDIVLFMSNGAFDQIHEKLINALG